MPIEKAPAKPVPKGYVPPNSTKYRVKDGDDWVKLAKAHGLDPWDLIEANFKTRAPSEVNWYLRHHVGCKVATKDGRNWTFTSSAEPGIVYIPRMPPLYFVVPNMKLIPQDKDMSCWFASGQMLIQWRWRTSRACEAAHPDPSMLRKWSKLYDDNPGINNSQIAAFALDLGLAMLPPMTPSPAYVKDLLRLHGPLWVNGKSHITVIAGIRNSSAGVEVLVYDPGKPALKNGTWHEFYAHYGLTPHTSLDASAGSSTSMLYVSSVR